MMYGLRCTGQGDRQDKKNLNVYLLQIDRQYDRQDRTDRQQDNKDIK